MASLKDAQQLAVISGYEIRANPLGNIVRAVVILLGNPDEPLRVEDHRLTSREDDRCHGDGAAPCPGAGRPKAQ